MAVNRDNRFAYDYLRPQSLKNRQNILIIKYFLKIKNTNRKT